MNIIRTEQQTPQRIASAIIEQDEYSWVIPCEGCGELRRQNKVEYRPIGTESPLDVVQVIKTAPEARRCMACGPFTN